MNPETNPARFLIDLEIKGDGVSLRLDKIPEFAKIRGNLDNGPIARYALETKEGALRLHT